MKQDTLDWALCRSFLAVLREGSLSAAARALGLSQPTLGRHLEGLEQALGTALFVRSTSGLVPTETALNLRQTAEAMEASAAAFLRTASAEAQSVGGTVRITASEVIGGEVLPGILAGLKRRHQALTFELILSNANQDLLRHEADIAVRMVRPTQNGLIARKVADLQIGLFAHDSWLDGRTLPASLQALAEQGLLIGYDRDPSMLRALQARGISAGLSAFGFRSDSDLAQLAALRAGFGVGVCQIALARRYSDLTRVLPDLSFELEAWVVTHQDIASVRRIRLTLEALADGLRRYASR